MPHSSFTLAHPFLAHSRQSSHSILKEIHSHFYLRISRKEIISTSINIKKFTQLEIRNRENNINKYRKNTYTIV